MKAISIGYHDVFDESAGFPSTAFGAANAYSLAAENFRRHLQGIQQCQNPIRTLANPREWREDLAVFLTFDDGALSAYIHVADELEKYNWRGHFFVVTNWIGKPGFLDQRQIRALRDRGHIIGSHSVSHPERMSELESADLAKEWNNSISVLSEIMGAPVKVASVPNGYYARRVARAAARAGIEVLFTSEPTTIVRTVDGCMVLGRYFIRQNSPTTTSGQLAAGKRWPRWQQSLLWAAKKPLKKLTGDSYISLRRYFIAKDSV